MWHLACCIVGKPYWRSCKRIWFLVSPGRKKIEKNHSEFHFSIRPVLQARREVKFFWKFDILYICRVFLPPLISSLLLCDLWPARSFLAFNPARFPQNPSKHTPTHRALVKRQLNRINKLVDLRGRPPIRTFPTSRTSHIPSLARVADWKFVRSSSFTPPGLSGHPPPPGSRGPIPPPPHDRKGLPPGSKNLTPPS